MEQIEERIIMTNIFMEVDIINVLHFRIVSVFVFLT